MTSQPASEKCGDVLVFDPDTPWSTVNHGAIGALVRSVRGLDATHVLADDEGLLSEGRFARTSDGEAEAILEDARGRGMAAAKRAGPTD